MPATARRFARALDSGKNPWIALCLVCGASFIALAIRGFNLGFYSDVLDYHYHYHFDGLIGGMNWLVSSHWQRHVLGALFSAPLHMLAPDRYDLWYALALAAHFSLGLVVFLLVDTLQGHRRRWLTLAISLLFLFDPLQTPSTLGFGTGTHRKAALLLALLALWAYVHFTRGRRRQLAWYCLNIACFSAALMIYEQSVFFFLLQPLIAIVEDRKTGEFSPRPRYLWLLARDVCLHVFFSLIYIYLLLILFPGGNANLNLSPSHILRQFADGLVVLLSPLEYIDRLAFAASLSQAWLLGLIALAVAVVFGSWLSAVRNEPGAPSTDWTPAWLLAFGLALVLLNIAGTAPTRWAFRGHERLLYASSVGSALLILGALAWLVERRQRLGRVLFVAFLCVTLAPGISFLYEQQAIYLAEDRASNRVFQAVYRAIPAFAADAKPYLLLVTDRDPQAELAVHPGDMRFPYNFALHYGIRDFRADALLHDHAEKYSRFGTIKLTEAGIVSPLSPHEIIAYDRLVVLAYDSAADQATVLERVPDAALLTANVDFQVDVQLETNWSLLP